MKTKFIKTICVGVVLIMSVAILCACNKNEEADNHDAIILDRANVLMKEEFLKSVPSYGGQFGEDTVLLVKNKEEFDEIFIGFPMSLNFDKEMLVVCVFADINYGFPCKLEDIRNDTETLMVYLSSDLPRDEFGTPPCASLPPTQRVVVVKTKKEDVTKIKIYWK